MKTKALWPHRVAVTLLYGYPNGVEKIGPLDYMIDNGPFAAFLGLTNSRLKGYLGQLKDLGVAETVKTGHGWARVKLAAPDGLQEKQNDGQ